MSVGLRRYRAEFDRPEDEHEFRTWSFHEARDQAMIAVVVTPILVLVGLPGDFATLGVERGLVWALPLRLGFLAFGAALFYRFRRTTQVRDIDRNITVFQVALLLLFLYFIWLTPLARITHLLVALFIILAAYLIFPNRFSNMVRLGVVASVGYMIASALLQRPSGPQTILIAEALVVANVFGAVTGYRLHVLKRREYLRLIEERRLIEELRTLNIELEALATTDSLTGISNRRHFFALATDEMARSKRYERPFSVLMIDIDEFKHVNDRNGHATGDDVLKAVVQTCITALRETDIFGRFGGDEFAILLPETADGGEQAERLRAAVERLRTPLENGDDLSVTVSIGVASACLTDKSVDDILGRADEAMYQAKASGRNQVVRG